MAGNRIKVIHDKIGEISVGCGTRYYSDDQRNFVEIAFFDKEDEWYLDVVEPFGEYQETAGRTCVYPWVPTELVEKWLTDHGAPTDIKSLPYQQDADVWTTLLSVADVIEGKERPTK
jgi:hypothetical protein